MRVDALHIQQTRRDQPSHTLQIHFNDGAGQTHKVCMTSAMAPCLVGGGAPPACAAAAAVGLLAPGAGSTSSSVVLADLLGIRPESRSGERYVFPSPCSH